MRTVCLDPVTPQLLIARRSGSGDVAARHVEHYRSCPCLGGTDVCCVPSCCPPFLSFVTVDRPPPAAECNCRGYAIGSYHSLDCATLGPSPWIGQRVAIYARRTFFPNPADGEFSHFERQDGTWGLEHWSPRYELECDVVRDAIVGSGTLAEALPVYVKGDCGMTSAPHICVWGPNELVYYGEGIEARFISDQLPLQDWSPGRWALRFTDVAPTSERCPWCGTRRRWYEAEAWPGEIFNCIICCDDGYTSPVVAPVLSSDDPTYKEWTP